MTNSPDDHVELRELRIWVCVNCINRKPGTCHVPGCFYCRYSIKEVPTYLSAYVVDDQALQPTKQISEDILHIATDEEIAAAAQELLARIRRQAPVGNMNVNMTE